MSDDILKRRDFLKRAGIAASVLATSVVAVAATTEGQHRGHRGNSENIGDGVVVGSSNKKEILYTKTQNWEEFYQAAK
ncbi:MAG: twin-arginine translocation signal domain-containing protein [Sulfurimonas sp.]|nr:twin-arginine translocation signal domain-containing protein [Sulfurimonas sp.]MDD3834141.1 twin-arginine translocation signal domain-containing protein [Sulfurimonas sp.]